MNDKLRNLSGVEVFRELQSFNKQLGDFLLENDVEGFLKCADEFSQSGINRNPCFENVLIAYRMAKPHYYVEDKPADLIIEDLKDYGLFDFGTTFPDFDDETIAQMITLADTAKSAPKKSRKPTVAEKKRSAAFTKLFDTYKEFIRYDETPLNSEDDAKLKDKCCYDYINPMIECRGQIDCFLNFNKFAIKTFDARDKLYDKISDATTFEERLKAIHEAVEVAHDIAMASGGKLSEHDFYEIKSPYAETKEEKAKYSVRQFMLGFFNHGVVTNMFSGIFPQNPFFYIALAMFLSIPTTDRVEAFINKFGYSMNSPFICLWKKEVHGKTYHFYGNHFRKWFDCGIDYFLIYQLLCKEWGK